MDWYYFRRDFPFLEGGISRRFAIYSNSPGNGRKLVSQALLYRIDVFCFHIRCAISKAKVMVDLCRGHYRNSPLGDAPPASSSVR